MTRCWCCGADQALKLRTVPGVAQAIEARLNSSQAELEALGLTFTPHEGLVEVTGTHALVDAHGAPLVYTPEPEPEPQVAIVATERWTFKLRGGFGLE